MSEDFNSAPVVTGGGNSQERLESVFDVVSRIQKVSAGEKRGGHIDPEFLSLKERWDLWMIGYRKTLISGLYTAAFTPLLVGVVENLIPVFGDKEPTVVDNILAFGLTVGFPLAYAMVTYHLGEYYTGEYTKVMIRRFLFGVVWGAITKIAIVFIGFHTLSLWLMTDRNLATFVLLFEHTFSAAKLNALFHFLCEMREVLLTSAWFVLAITLIVQIFIPLASIGLRIWSERQKRGVDGFPA